MTRLTNWTLAIAVLGGTFLTGCGDSAPTGGATTQAASAGKKITVGMLPKRKGINYFTSCASGAADAAKELGNVELVYDGPTEGDPTKAADLVGQWALQGFDVIAVSADDGNILGAAMKKAQAAGPKTIAWDADVPADSRTFFVNQATPQQIGYALLDAVAKDCGESGEFAIMSSSQTAANQNEWLRFMNERLAKYPNLKLVATEYPGEDQDRCLSTARTLMKAHPNLKAISGISTVSFPGAAEAVRQEKKIGAVKVSGLSTPNPMKGYVADGTVTSVVLWDTRDLGYLTIYVAEAVANGKLKPGDTTFKAGRLGERKVVGDQVLLGDMLTFDKSNIDKFDF